MKCGTNERKLPEDGLKSSVGFYKACKLLQQSKGNRVREPGNRNLSRTYSLFVNGLKQYQESHKLLKDVYQIIAQASHDTGGSYIVSKCVEIVFKHGKMMRWKGVPVLDEPIEIMDPDKNEIYKCLGVEQADGIKTKAVFERAKSKVEKGSRC